MNDSAIQRLRREENMAVSAAVRENILFIQQHGYARGHRPANQTSPPRELEVHRDSDPDDEDGDADDRVGARRPRRGIHEDPPGTRMRRNDPHPQEYVVCGSTKRRDQEHKLNAVSKAKKCGCDGAIVICLAYKSAE